MNRRVVITGHGLVCPIGNNSKEVLDNWQAGRIGFSKPVFKMPCETNITSAGRVLDFNASDYYTKKELKVFGRDTQYALVAAKEALAQSEVLDSANATRVGCLMGVGASGDMQSAETGYHDLFVKGHPQVKPNTILVTMTNASTAHISMRFGLKGHISTVATACASSTHAIGESSRLISFGYADAMVVGGADAPLTMGVWKGWEALRVLSPDGCKPFSLNRNGMTLSEGAGILVLEERSHAVKRGATILGEIKGFSSNADADGLIRPNQDSIANCMRNAIIDSGIDQKDVGFISAHGTGTIENDRVETAAIKAIYNHIQDLNPPPICATKSMHGHLMGASGIVETIIALQAMNQNKVPPTMNLSIADPECDLNYVANKPISKESDYVLKNSFAFGGINACLIIGSQRTAIA